MRDHFDDAPSAGVVCYRLHAFLHFQGEQVTDDNYRSIGLIGLTIGIGITLLLYKFTYGHPELRIPGMAIALFLGMWLSRVLVLGPLGFLIGFVVADSQSIGEAVPSPELLVRGILWLWVAIAYGAGLTVVLNLLFLPDATGPPAHPPKPKSSFCVRRVYQSRTRALRAQSHPGSDVLLHLLFRRSTGPGSTPR